MFSSQEEHLYIRTIFFYLIVSQRGLQQLPLLKPQNESKKRWEEKKKLKKREMWEGARNGPNLNGLQYWHPSALNQADSLHDHGFILHKHDPVP